MLRKIKVLTHSWSLYSKKTMHLNQPSLWANNRLKILRFNKKINKTDSLNHLDSVSTLNKIQEIRWIQVLLQTILRIIVSSRNLTWPTLKLKLIIPSQLDSRREEQVSILALHRDRISKSRITPHLKVCSLTRFLKETRETKELATDFEYNI